MIKNNLVVWVLSAALLSITGVLRAAEESAEAVQNLSGPLDLAGVVAYALRSNPDLKSEALAQEIANEGVSAERYYWEPELVASGKREENQRQNTVQQELSQSVPIFEERNWSYSAGIEGQLPTGTRWRVGYTLDDLKNNLTNLTYRTHAAFAPEYASFAGITLTQPLMKNFGPKITTSRLQNAKLQQEISRQGLRRRTMLTVGRAELAYWNVWQARQSVDLRAKSLEIAQTLLADNIKRQAEGRMSVLEVEQAKAGVALRERRWLEAQTIARDARRVLLSVLGWAPGDTELDIKTDITPETKIQTADFADAMLKAMDRHPDMLIRKTEIETENLRLAVSRNQRWPQLDLVASYGLNGLGDDTQASLDYLQDAEYPSWSVMVVFKLPLGGDQKARALHHQAKLKKEQALLNYKSTESDLVNGLQAIFDKVKLVHETLAALDREVAVNRGALDAEKTLLENGKSTSRRVLEQEQDLSDACVDQIGAIANYRRVLVELDMTDGAMLERRGLEKDLEPTAPAAAPSSPAEAV